MITYQIIGAILLILIAYQFIAHRKMRRLFILKLAEATDALDKSNIINNELNLLLIEKSSIINDYSERYHPIINIDNTIKEKEIEVTNIEKKMSDLSQKYVGNFDMYASLYRQIALYRSDLKIMEYGLYQPQFNFETSEEYKQRLETNYLRQRDCIRLGNAVVCHTNWQVEGSTSKGNQMTNKYSKLMLYAFNGECDGLIAKIKWNNATRTKERIQKAFASINKLGELHNIEITNTLLQLKLEEMALTHEYENKKYDEKEEQRRIKEQMREEEKVQKELERARRDAEEEEHRFQKALKKVREDLQYASKEDVEALNNQIMLLEQKLHEAAEKRERAISLAQQTKVGHIYIISNIGSFGEDVYKIGMTRRLEPHERVKELGDASVPFYFDVHAIIYSDNAPQMEYELHKKFQNHRLNKINGRKEFFRIKLEEIEEFVKHHAGAEIELTKVAEAKEYRETLAFIENSRLKEDALLQMEEDKFPSTLPN